MKGFDDNMDLDSTNRFSLLDSFFLDDGDNINIGDITDVSNLSILNNTNLRIPKLQFDDNEVTVGCYNTNCDQIFSPFDIEDQRSNVL